MISFLSRSAERISSNFPIELISIVVLFGNQPELEFRVYDGLNFVPFVFSTFVDDKIFIICCFLPISSTERRVRLLTPEFKLKVTLRIAKYQNCVRVKQS